VVLRGIVEAVGAHAVFRAQDPLAHHAHDGRGCGHVICGPTRGERVQRLDDGRRLREVLEHAKRPRSEGHAPVAETDDHMSVGTKRQFDVRSAPQAIHRRDFDMLSANLR
jgi:hypothetical protein